MRNVLIFVFAISVPIVVGIASNLPGIKIPNSNVRTQSVLELKLVPVQGATFRGKIAEDCQNSDGDMVIVVTNGRIEINRQLIPTEEFKEVLGDIFKERRCKIAFLDIDASMSYGEFTKVVDVMIGQGIVVNLMTEGLKSELGYPK